MTKAKAALQQELDRVTARLGELFPSHRLERDKNAEPILWIKAPDELLPVLRQLMKDPGLGVDRLSDITAYDNVDRVDGPKRFVVVHQLYMMKTHARMRLKLNVDESDDVPSLTEIWKAANWLERETYDMFGVRFSKHPDLRRLLMDERFVGHPLRKEYDLKDRQPFPDTLPVRIAERTVREEEPYS